MPSCCCCACIGNKDYGILQNCGKFIRVLGPGFTCFPWPCYNLSGTVSTKQQQLHFTEEAKTRDDTFVKLTFSVIFYIDAKDVELNYYCTTDSIGQIQSFIRDSIRTMIPSIALNDLFLEKQKISSHLQDDLTKKMASMGYNITDVLLLDINPDQSIKDAMNRITTSKRSREAATFEAETEYIIAVKKAEAEAQAKRLQGEGVAAQRKAIVTGMRESVDTMSKSINVPPEDTMKYTMLTQYFDVLKDIGTSDNKAVIFIPHNPSSVTSYADQIKASIMESNLIDLESIDHKDTHKNK